MKIIMHIGMPKTGSTAIQFALTKNREKMLSRGILYPINPDPFSNQVKHSIYVSMLRRGDSDQWNRFPEAETKIISTFGSNFDYYNYWMEDLKKQISVAKPHTLVISEEGFFGTLANKKSKIHDNLRNFFNELNVNPENVQFVGYLRNPPDYYLSSCQQNLKSKPEIRNIKSANYIPIFKRIIENYKAQSKIFSFDKKIFPEGDVVKHFVKLFSNLELGSLGKPNETISGPAMSILQDYRTIFHTDKKEKQSPSQVEFLINALREGDRRLGLERPTLRNEIKEVIWNTVATDLHWLSQNFEIDFNPPKIQSELKSVNSQDEWNPRSVEDIIDFDLQEKNKLLYEVIFELSKKQKIKK